MSVRFWRYVTMAVTLAGVAFGFAAEGLSPGALAIILAISGLVMALVLGIVLEPQEAPPPPAEAAAPVLPAGAPAQLRLDWALVEGLPVALLLVERTGRIAAANEAAREMFPRLGQATHFVSLVRAPAFVEAVNAGLETGRAQRAEFSMFRGQDRYLRVHVAPSPGLRGGAEEPARPGEAQVLVLIEDLTRDRRVEQLRADFISNASHELRTPLASLTGYIETLQGAARDDAPARERFLGIMARQAERMKRLVDDLLSLSQIEMNEHVAPRTPCRLHELAREAAATLGPIAAKREARISVSLPDEEVWVRGDRDQLIQVFVNLLDNAMKYGASPHPIEIVAPAADPRWPGRAGIAVVDRGPGIPREHVPRLTERFYRVSPQASREKGGTGLGLAIVKHILNRHRGELQIESAPGQGSRFTVWLPRLKGPPGEADAAETPGADASV